MGLLPSLVPASLGSIRRVKKTLSGLPFARTRCQLWKQAEDSERSINTKQVDLNNYCLVYALLEADHYLFHLFSILVLDVKYR
jgi:hypothetical protein